MQVQTPFNLTDDTAGTLFTHNAQQLGIMHPLSIGKNYSALYLQPTFITGKGGKKNPLLDSLYFIMLILYQPTV